MINHRHRLRALRTGTSTVTALLAAVAFVPARAGQQNPPPLQIKSPANNAIVNPGESLSVSVVSPANTTFTNVGVIASGPIDTGGTATSVPAQFPLNIPANISLGKHMLTAVGTSSGNQVLYSPTIFIDVERADLPTQLTVNHKKLPFSAPGYALPFRIYGFFSDGNTLDVTGSSYLSFSSSNASVATASTSGSVRAFAQGSAVITATYTLTNAQGTHSVSVSIPVTVQPPATTPLPSSLNFNPQAVGTSSPPQTLTIANATASDQLLKVGPVTALGDFSETDNCASSSPVPVGGVCTINVTFAPTVVGAESGAILVRNDLTGIALSVPVTGTGSALAPSITSISPTYGCPGTSVTITGTNFGATEGTSKVTFGSVTETATSWSSTTIVANATGGGINDTNVNVSVTVGAKTSNPETFNIYGRSNVSCQQPGP